MAVLFLDSFDHYATADILAKWTTFGGNGTIIGNGGRRGGGAFSGSFGSTIGKVGLPTTDPTVILGVATKIGNGSISTWSVINVYLSGTLQLSVVVTALGGIEIRRGSTSAPLLGSWPGPLALNQYYYFELKTVVHPTAGSVVFRINEAPVITVPGPVNTAAAGVVGWNAFNLSCVNGGNAMAFDDLYVLDGTGPAPLNDLIGDCRVDVRIPQTEGTYHTWAPSTGGDRAAMVDDMPNPDGDATFNATATIGALDTFTVADVAVPGAAFYGVQLVQSQKKSDAGACAIAPVVRVGSGGVPTDFVGTPANPGTVYNYLLTPYSLNPGTGAPWTEAEFNAAEFGYKRTA